MGLGNWACNAKNTNGPPKFPTAILKPTDLVVSPRLGPWALSLAFSQPQAAHAACTRQRPFRLDATSRILTWLLNQSNNGFLLSFADQPLLQNAVNNISRLHADRIRSAIKWRPAFVLKRFQNNFQIPGFASKVRSDRSHKLCVTFFPLPIRLPRLSTISISWVVTCVVQYVQHQYSSFALVLH